MEKSRFPLPMYLVLFLLLWACSERKSAPSRKALNELNLRAGKLITCGPPDQQFGTVSFPISCRPETQADFALALKLLHSFEYEEAEKVFSAIIDKQPECVMAYWGVAMSNFHPLWTPPTEPELQKGAAAISLAQALPAPSPKEADYLAAVATFYQQRATVDHRTRCLRFEQAMEKLAAKYPGDKEATIFYALALTAAADPTDKTYSNQKKAGTLLSARYPSHPDHPGIVHYLIHTYDVPKLAELALPAARKYASVAPSSAHALHMPSHIFTRLGLWQEDISSNLASVAAAQCYAEQAGIKGHWDEKLHGLDYLMYSYLQQGNNTLAKRQWAYLNTISTVEPVSFKVAYAFAAIPARYVLENKQWQEASQLQSHSPTFPWEKFPWQKAILHFTRLLGAAHIGNQVGAEAERQELNRLEALLTQQKDAYKANQVHIQLTAGTAWIRLQEGKAAEALALMSRAAAMEDSTEKHPVTPGEVLPAKELLADMYLQLRRPTDALIAYESSLQQHPNRFNSLYGAGRAAEQAGNPDKARRYYQQLLAIAAPRSARPEVAVAQRFLEKQSLKTSLAGISSAKAKEPAVVNRRLL